MLARSLARPLTNIYFVRYVHTSSHPCCNNNNNNYYYYYVRTTTASERRSRGRLILFNRVLYLLACSSSSSTSLFSSLLCRLLACTVRPSVQWVVHVRAAAIEPASQPAHFLSWAEQLITLLSPGLNQMYQYTSYTHCCTMELCSKLRQNVEKRSFFSINIWFVYRSLGSRCSKHVISLTSNH